VTAVLHAILDRQVDGLESVLDNIEARVETLEDAVFARPKNALIASLLSIKRNNLELRRWTAKQREVLLRLGRREFALISAEEALLFRDVHDHLVRINDLLEGFRDMLTSIQEAYLSAVSNRTNDIMRFLTLFSTIMMPLTVLTGVYGMNFDHMPELHSVYGYPLVLVGMLVIAGTMLLYFRHRGWLGRPPRLDEDVGDSKPEEAPKPTRSRRTTSRRARVKK
jgi:magnesium transporter